MGLEEGQGEEIQENVSAFDCIWLSSKARGKAMGEKALLKSSGQQRVDSELCTEGRKGNAELKKKPVKNAWQK